MEDIVEVAPPAPGRRLSPVAFVAAGLVAGVVLAGATVAGAQSGDPTPTPSVGPQAPEQPRFGKHRGHGGPRGPHFGKGMLHGEFVTTDPDGGYQTMAVQHGEVTAVSPTSLTVRSEDGYSRTYAVNDDTLVNAGDEGIDDVSKGDQVHVMAVVEDGSARAVRVHDVTTVSRLRGKWMPRRPDPTQSPSAAT